MTLFAQLAIVDTLTASTETAALVACSWTLCHGQIHSACSTVVIYRIQMEVLARSLTLF